MLVAVEAARAAAQALADERAVDLAAQIERVGRAEGEAKGLREAAEGARADREAALARLVALEGELTLLRESVVRLAAVEGELAAVRDALTEARRPWWRRWGR
jgi:hypothetical protein